MDTKSYVVILVSVIGASQLVVFDKGASSFNKGIVVRSGGVLMSTNVSTKNTKTEINAGTGALTIASGQLLSTNNQVLAIISDDIDIQG